MVYALFSVATPAALMEQPTVSRYKYGLGTQDGQLNTPYVVIDNDKISSREENESKLKLGEKIQLPNLTPKLKRGHFTVDNVVEALKGLKSREVAQYLGINDKVTERRLTHSCSKNKKRIEKLVDFWQRKNVKASWRQLIIILDNYNLCKLADTVRSFAEENTDPTFTYENVSATLKTVNKKMLRDYLGVPDCKIHEIRKEHSDQYIEYLIKYWMANSHLASWEGLATKLYFFEEKPALKAVKKYLQNETDRDALTDVNVLSVLSACNQDWKFWTIQGLPYWLDIPDAKIQQIELTYSSIGERRAAIVLFWLKNHPCPSWNILAYTLYLMEQYSALESIFKKYIIGSSMTRYQFSEAMKFRGIDTSITKVVLFGAAGSGKTCSKNLILELPPPNVRESTPLAIRPVRVSLVNLTPLQWKLLTAKDIDDIIARASLLDDTLEEETDTSIPKTETAVQTEIESKVPSMNLSADNEIVVEKPKKSHKLRSSKVQMKATRVTQTNDRFIEIMEDYTIDKHLKEMNMVEMTDSGGQPQFHEILPIFLKGTSMYIYVSKLSEEFGARSMVEYYDNEGKEIGKAYQASQSNEQIFRHCLRTLQSQKPTGVSKQAAKILILGTHKDQADKCQETIKEKDEKFIKLLLPTFKCEIIYNSLEESGKSVIIPINAKQPGEYEKEVAALIQRLISKECRADPITIPLRWHALQSLIDKLTQKLERNVITKEECFNESLMLHFDQNSFEAALEYLDQLNLIIYYHDILPEMVFASSQVLLDKVTELVQETHKLRKGLQQGPDLRGNDWQRFTDYALVTTDFLKQKEFQKHYCQGFTEVELVKLFRKLLIFADFNDTEFFMPALLQSIDEKQLSEHRVNVNDCELKVSPIILSFPRTDGPQLGVFCSTLVSLLSTVDSRPFKLKLKMDRDNITPTCLHRNCVELVIESYPGKIVLIDSFHFFEVHVHLPIEKEPKICLQIKSVLEDAVQKAMLNLNYSFELQIGFVCPCGEGEIHIAEYNTTSNKWICSNNNDKYGEPTKEHTIWKLGEINDLKQDPQLELTMATLMIIKPTGSSKNISVIRELAPNWKMIGLSLDFDKTASKLDQIEADNRDDCRACCCEMFKYWLAGNGIEATWENLIRVIEDDEPSFADNIKSAVGLK